jgi:hypothetical protein
MGNKSSGISQRQPLPSPAPVSAPIIIGSVQQPALKPTYQPSPEQIQAATNDNFTWYSISTYNPMSKLKIDLPAFQQCVSTNNAGDCISQYFKGLDNNTNSLQSMIKGNSGITVDSGGNIIWQQNFQNIENTPKCNLSPNTILFTLLIVFLIVILTNDSNKF